MTAEREAVPARVPGGQTVGGRVDLSGGLFRLAGWGEFGDPVQHPQPVACGVAEAPGQVHTRRVVQRGPVRESRPRLTHVTFHSGAECAAGRSEWKA
jgi:hypothetical protein